MDHHAQLATLVQELLRTIKLVSHLDLTRYLVLLVITVLQEQ